LRKDETRIAPVDFQAMDHTATTEDAFAELNALIAKAIVEDDDMRSKALLIMADHWSAVLRGRDAPRAAPRGADARKPDGRSGSIERVPDAAGLTVSGHALSSEPS